MPPLPIPPLSPPRFRCDYPQSNALSVPVASAVAAIAAGKNQCASFYLDTVQSMSDPGGRQGENHHQGLARTHLLSGNSIFFFLSHSEVDPGSHGSISAYNFKGPLEAEHVRQTKPLTVAHMAQIVMLDERHPSDIVFLPDVNGGDAGYLFVCEEYDGFRLSCYRWDLTNNLVYVGAIPAQFDSHGPQFVFVDRVDDVYYLGIASSHWGAGSLVLYSAASASLFPGCAQGGIDIAAFKEVAPGVLYPFPPRGTPCQVKLIRDSTGKWYLLAFCSEPDDDPHGTDYIDTYEVVFAPFSISSSRVSRVHIAFAPGDTGFASTGTHYIEKSGRLLVSSSYRWSEDEGPAGSGYVSRVDEVASWKPD